MIEFLVWAMLNFGLIYFGAWGIYLWWKYGRKPKPQEAVESETRIIHLGTIPAGAKITGVSYNPDSTLEVEFADGDKLVVDVAEKIREHGRSNQGR